MRVNNKNINQNILFEYMPVGIILSGLKNLVAGREWVMS